MTTTTTTTTRRSQSTTMFKMSSSPHVSNNNSNNNNNNNNNNNYVRQDGKTGGGGSISSSSSKKTPPPLYPKVGDIVRYYDLDGGRTDGEVLVGKISFIQKQTQPTKGVFTNNNNNNNNNPVAVNNTEWLVELSQLEDVGDGYYATYSSSWRQRQSKKALRRLQDVSPIAASFVKSENAYKVPRNATTLLPLVRAEQYDIDTYRGPTPTVGTGGNTGEYNPDVVAQDAIVYANLKYQLFRNAAIVGVIGTLMADWIKGTEDAVIYAAGVLASLAYLVFLSIKTDTIASPNAKFGSNVSNVRFLMPVLVVAGIALYNQNMGGGGGGDHHNANPFDRITPEQFGAAMLGFLTYRIPLFLSQIQVAFQSQEDENQDQPTAGLVLPGSAGIVVQQLTQQQSAAASSSSSSKATTTTTAATTDLQDLIPVLVVSGPQATGRSELVRRLVEESKQDNDNDNDGTIMYVVPTWMDRYQVNNGATFERMEQRGEFLELDPTGRFGLTKQSILTAAATTTTTTTGDNTATTTTTIAKPRPANVVVVVDASVQLAKKLMMTLSGTRLIGVWIGLSSVDDFKTRLEAMIDRGEIVVPSDETKDSIVRAKIRDIVKEIEFGVVSGLFEFTILNDDDDEQSLQQLKEAAAYAFR